MVQSFSLVNSFSLVYHAAIAGGWMVGKWGQKVIRRAERRLVEKVGR